MLEGAGIFFSKSLRSDLHGVHLTN